MTRDIQYREGIIEYLEQNSNLDFIIIDEKVPGNINIESLIEKINKINEKIKIIIRTDEINIKNKKYKRIENIDKIEIINSINNDKIFGTQEIKTDKIIEEEKREGKIITILGPNGIGKSVFSITFASNIDNKKILIMDFDILNNSLHTLLGVDKYSEKIQNNINKEYIEKDLEKYLINFNKININDFIIKTKYKIDLISGINLIFDSKYQVSPTKIRNIINKIKNQYDLIIIDTSSECFLDYTRELINLSEKSIFISGANVLEVKKARTLLEIYEKEWGIRKENINIIFNKYTNQSIENETLKNIFYKYRILGNIRLNDYYDLAINNNNSKIKEIKKDINKIKNKIIREEKRKIRN